MRVLIVAILSFSVACASEDLTKYPDSSIDGSNSDLFADSVSFDATVDSVSPDSTADAPPPPPSAWQEMSTNLSGSFNAIWGTSASDLFVVGEGGMILHYDGTSWSKMVNSETQDLFGIWGTSSTQVYAVGSGVVLEYDGTSWSEDDSGSYKFGLRGVWGVDAKTLWAVGTDSTIKYRGTSWWSSVSSSDIPIKDQDFRAIWGVDATNFYVVGNNGSILRSTNSGDSFEAQASGTTANLTSIWGSSATDIYIAGVNGTVLHSSNGTTWTNVGVTSSTSFNGISGSGPNDVYVVGLPLINADEGAFHYDGTDWGKVTPPGTPFLKAVTAFSSTEIFAVGQSTLLKYVGLP